MADVPDDYSVQKETTATPMVDERGRLVSRCQVDFTCPGCGEDFDIEVTLPWSQFGLPAGVSNE